MDSSLRTLRITGALTLTWGVGGVVAILVSAIYRLTPRATTALQMELEPTHWVFAVAWTLFMLYTEAWRGFHLKFSPRVISRACHLASHPHPLRVLLAPLFCMSFFHSPPRRILASWILTFGIVGVVLVVKLLEQPWRGLVDLGVVLGLAGGVLTLILESLRVARGGQPVDPELPLSSPAQSQTSTES